MLQPICVCDVFPSVSTRHRWVFVQHFTEDGKTTNKKTMIKGIANAQFEKGMHYDELEWQPDDEVIKTGKAVAIEIEEDE